MPTVVPILMYHRVYPESKNRNTVLLDNFKRQLEYLKQESYTTILMHDLCEHLDGKKDLPAKSVLLSFDDGYEDNFTYVFPLLQQYDMKAIVFPVAEWIGQTCGWKKHDIGDRLMNWEQLSTWQAAGMEIGSHTVHHVRLSTLSGEDIQLELQQSKSMLEERLGTPIDYLCYPYGDFDERVKQCAQHLGYRAALAIHNGTPFMRNDKYALRRVGISSRTSLWEFGLRISKAFSLFVGTRNLETKIKSAIKSVR